MLGRKRVTGRELARRLDVSQPWVSYRLTGHKEIGLTDLERIAQALGVEIAELLPAPARRDGGSRVGIPATSTGPRSTHRLGHVVRPSVDPQPAERTNQLGDNPPQTGQPAPARRPDRDRPHRPTWTHAR